MVLPSKRINNKFLRMVPGEPHQAELQGMPSGEGSASAVHDTVNTDEISVSARDAPVHKKPYSNPNIPSTQVSAERLVARKFGPILLMAIIVLLAFYRSDAYGTDILLTAGSHSAMAVGFGFALHGVFFPFFKKGKVKEYSVLPPLMLSTAFSFALSGIYYFSN